MGMYGLFYICKTIHIFLLNLILVRTEHLPEFGQNPVHSAVEPAAYTSDTGLPATPPPLQELCN
jgi:hypothetical protein